MTRPLGWLPDPPKAEGDEADWSAGLLLGVAPVPSSATCRHLITSILNQGNLGSCVANSGFQAIRASHVRQGVANPKLGSRRAGYYLARAFGHLTNVDSGTHLRTFFQMLNKFGFASEELDPYNIAKFTEMPPTAYFQAAFDQKAPTTYRRIYETGYDRVDAVKRAIAQGYPVCFGTDVDAAFVNGDLGDAPLKPPRSNIAGGHAMLFAEYDGNAFGVVNSWGDDFGDEGWCTFDADYVAWDGTRDLWVVEHAPKYSGGTP